MRSVSSGVVRVAVVSLLVSLLASAAFATEGNPYEPPEARIRVPTGITATAKPPSFVSRFMVWLQARIGPPIG
jgi:hypothetical protein